MSEKFTMELKLITMDQKFLPSQKYFPQLLMWSPKMALAAIFPPDLQVKRPIY